MNPLLIAIMQIMSPQKNTYADNIYVHMNIYEHICMIYMLADTYVYKLYIFVDNEANICTQTTMFADHEGKKRWKSFHPPHPLPPTLPLASQPNPHLSLLPLTLSLPTLFSLCLMCACVCMCVCMCVYVCVCVCISEQMPLVAIPKGGARGPLLLAFLGGKKLNKHTHTQKMLRGPNWKGGGEGKTYHVDLNRR
jgi:hypothetical protein